MKDLWNSGPAPAPIGARLRIGKKRLKENGDSAGFLDVGVFNLGSPHVSSTGAIPDAPAFATFNASGREFRKTFKLEIVHAALGDAMEAQLSAFRGYAGDPTPPGNRYFCSGPGGDTAERWRGPDYVAVPCGDLCKYRSSHADGKRVIPAHCKPITRLLGVPVWKEGTALPRPLVKFTSQSVHTLASLRGLRRHLEATAAELGLAEPSYYGVQILLTVETRRNAAGMPFNSVSFSLLNDLQTVLLEQQARRIKAAVKMPTMSEVMASPDERRAELVDIEMGNLPRAEGTG